MQALATSPVPDTQHLLLFEERDSTPVHSVVQAGLAAPPALGAVARELGTSVNVLGTQRERRATPILPGHCCVA